ncbi:hypothetical protein GCM10010329_70060 [Streptomyces spiroverticillatus]|uniref:Uncharacterized protein n=1 Tax=Streptomyces finlayi TaxID=67296 RepID=A0A919CBI7_9ACTN|nr:hypothetical protein GCM10010329_70060 [Streptomyces spiroverticillatus]GHD01738.1 hypothetical protein GCM10010334_47740 [Streptomyces finlayi]
MTSWAALNEAVEAAGWACAFGTAMAAVAASPAATAMKRKRLAIPLRGVVVRSFLTCRSSRGESGARCGVGNLPGPVRRSRRHLGGPRGHWGSRNAPDKRCLGSIRAPFGSRKGVFRPYAGVRECDALRPRLPRGRPGPK